MLAQWNDTFKTGHHEVDAQHQRLFGLVNDLHEAIVAGRGRDFQSTALKTLAEYCATHFSTEERMMDSLGYPESAQHKQLRRELMGQAKEILESYASGKTQLPLKLGHFLNNWLTHHIGDNDKIFINWVRAQPASASR